MLPQYDYSKFTFFNNKKSDEEYSIKKLYNKHLRVIEQQPLTKIFTNNFGLIYKNKIIGIIILSNDFNEILKNIFIKHNIEPEIIIHEFNVHPHFRNKGLSKLLLNVPLTQYNKIILMTQPQEYLSSSLAKQIYLKNGFSVIDKYDNTETLIWYYDKGKIYDD